MQRRSNALTTGLAHNEYDYPLDWSDTATRLEGDEEAMAEQARLEAMPTATTLVNEPPYTEIAVALERDLRSLVKIHEGVI